MKLLNLGCGSVRPLNQEWTNVDSWEGGGHEINEPNFVRHDLRNPLPFEDSSYDGILASHLIEHLDCQEALKLLREARRVLKPGGILMVSVPDASYFRQVHHEDRNENWPRLFDVSDPRNPIPTWRSAALFFDQHKQVFTEDSMWCTLVEAGFRSPVAVAYRVIEGDIVQISRPLGAVPEVFNQLGAQLNRLKFSLVMSALK